MKEKTIPRGFVVNERCFRKLTNPVGYPTGFFVLIRDGEIGSRTALLMRSRKAPGGSMPSLGAKSLTTL